MARKNPTITDFPKMDKHEQMAGDMHSALYTLQDKARKPFPRGGQNLLPSNLKEKPSQGHHAAKKHIERLHKAFKEGC